MAMTDCTPDQFEKLLEDRLSKLPTKACRIIKSAIATGRLLSKQQSLEEAKFLNCVFYGSAVGNSAHMEKITQNISGGTFNAPVGINQAFSNCYNTVGNTTDQKLQETLKSLIGEVEKIYPSLEEGEKAKTERKLKLLTEEATQKEPDKEQLALSGKGLIDAAQTCASMAAPVITCVKAVLDLFGVV